jgi:hypothetical protein
MIVFVWPPWSIWIVKLADEKRKLEEERQLKAGEFEKVLANAA